MPARVALLRCRRSGRWWQGGRDRSEFRENAPQGVASRVEPRPEYQGISARYCRVDKCNLHCATADVVPGQSSEGVDMYRTSVAQRIGRALVAAMFAVAAVSLTSPGTAYAKHGNGAAIALGIL